MRRRHSYGLRSRKRHGRDRPPSARPAAAGTGGTTRTAALYLHRRLLAVRRHRRRCRHRGCAVPSPARLCLDGAAAAPRAGLPRGRWHRHPPGHGLRRRRRRVRPFCSRRGGRPAGARGGKRSGAMAAGACGGSRTTLRAGPGTRHSRRELYGCGDRRLSGRPDRQRLCAALFDRARSAADRNERRGRRPTRRMGARLRARPAALRRESAARARLEPRHLDPEGEILFGGPSQGPNAK